MAPVVPEKYKSWADVNKERKQIRKKYKEEKFLKKLKKAEKEVTEKETTKTEATENVHISQKPLSTISIAVPGSILDNAQSSELRTYLAGQIARAACIFKVDEVVVFDDSTDTVNSKKSKVELENGFTTTRQCCAQLARILQYLECPQYLRKHFFPIHKDLQYAGVLNPLDAPHHLRQSNDFIFREGVISNKPTKAGKGSLVNVGLLQDVLIDKTISPGLRVTVKLKENQLNKKKLLGSVVSPLAPRQETGVYWGYSVRIADSLSQVFSKSPYAKGYDLTIGTSDKGKTVNEVADRSLSFDHAIIVFGGLFGLEAALESDESLNVEDPSLLFDEYLNTIPCQGSRTIRTEEAILLSMAVLNNKFNPNNEAKEFLLSDAVAQSSDTHKNTTRKDTSDADDMSKFD